MTEAPDPQAQQQLAIVPRSLSVEAQVGESQSADTMSSPTSHPERILIRQTDTAVAAAAVDQEAGVAVVATARRRTQFVATEEGFRYREVIMIEAAIIRIQSLERQEQAALEGPDEEVAEETYGEKCCELCFARVNGVKGFTTVVVKRQLREARDFGWRLLRGRVFPLFSNHVREIWTYLQFFITLAILLYSSISFGLTNKDERTIVDILLIAFSIASSLLSLLDLVITIYYQRCRLCRDCCRRMAEDGSNNPEHGPTRYGSNTIGANNPEHGLSDDEQTGQDACCCDQCCKLCCKNKYTDLFRLLLSEVLIYPIVICTMFHFILGITVDSMMDSKVGWKIAVFAGGILWKVLFVYVIRLVVLIRTVQAIQKARENGPGSTSGKWLQIRFILHVFGQMLVQVIMITCIGSKMYLENKNFSIDNTIHVSSYLWYLIVGGLLIPFTGIFTFAIVHFYTVQEYPIGLFLDLLGTLRSKSPGDAVSPQLKEKGEGQSFIKRVKISISPEKEEEARRLAHRIENEFKEIHNVNWYKKYLYVLQSPMLVVLCFIYSAFLFAFIFCYILEPSTLDHDTDAESTERLAFSLVGSMVVGIVNVGVVTMTITWIVLIGVLIISLLSCVPQMFLCCYQDTMDGNCCGEVNVDQMNANCIKCYCPNA